MCSLCLPWYCVVAACVDDEEDVFTNISIYYNVITRCVYNLPSWGKKVLLWERIMMLHIDSNFLLWTKLVSINESNAIYITMRICTVTQMWSLATKQGLLCEFHKDRGRGVDPFPSTKWDAVHWSNRVETKRILLIYHITHRRQHIEQRRMIVFQEKKKKHCFWGYEHHACGYYLKNVEKEKGEPV